MSQSKVQTLGYPLSTNRLSLKKLTHKQKKTINAGDNAIKNRISPSIGLYMPMLDKLNTFNYNLSL